jgi:L-cysteine:1D-myo-inositol 2-amino-2-deoxy-alpha-D-glucopyranoside ligase
VKSWTRPVVPRLPGHSDVPRLFDTATGTVTHARPLATANLYVCGITPYDATHIGHAATYLAFDTLIRLWLDGGFDVVYAQNTTDVDDPLLERARDTGVDWRELAASQTELYRGDMRALGVIPPDHFIAVTDMIEPIADAVRVLLDRGVAYALDGDIYFDSTAASAISDWTLGDESGLDRAAMLVLSAERGGDPDRVGKRDPLDPLLWRAARDGDPSWPSVVGEGRPGWHIECSVIAQQYLHLPATVNGGGHDLAFPHHEFSAGHTAALTGAPLANLYAHTALVSYQGEKMSKSLGNLVFVSRLIEDGVDPRAIRLAIAAQHYRREWEWADAVLTDAEERLARWVGWASHPGETADSALDELRAVLVNDLDTAGALAVIDARIADGTPADAETLAAIDALLGIRL